LFVKFFGWYENGDFVFIIMEYMKHGDLESHLKGPLPEEEACHITLQLAEGLQSLHDNGFAHRDLKPAVCIIAD
jgi:calcium/calmodulin-dependent protein kinase I